MGAVGTPLRHEAAHLHVSGRAVYVDDMPLPANTLHAAFGLSPVAHGQLRGLDLTEVLASDGVVAIATAADIPGHNNYGGIVADDPVFAGPLLSHAGQPMFAVAATSHRAAMRAAKRFRADIETRPAILDIRAALAADSYVIPSQTLRRGEPDRALQASAHRLTGTMVCGGQDHLYLEGQIAVAIPGEDGQLLIHCSTQHPTEVQHVVGEVLARPMQDITVQCRRMGGGFGGKESQPALLAAAAAVLAVKTGRPVKLRLDRDADMLVTGKRHDFLADYEVGFDDRGVITGLKVMLASRCGHSADLSGPVNDRAVCHVDNAYFLEHVEIVSHRCRTNTVSNTAFRGFGGPQGMLVVEDVLGRCAPLLGLDPADLRRRNFYVDGQSTPYGQPVRHASRIVAAWDQVLATGDVATRRAEIAAFNAAHPHVKRALALTPVKFGISFNFTAYNQAGALVHVYKDGSVLVNHGGTEMGQGLHTKMLQVAATALGVPLERVRLAPTRTDKVPNTSATAASSGADLNGAAVKDACEQVMARLEAVDAGRGLPWDELVREAYFSRVQLWAAGFYRTEGIHWDSTVMRGHPFKYFAYGVAAAEVEVDGFTGAHRTRRVDIVHDVGDSLSPLVDLGQVEGGFVQGAGWLTCEDLRWDESDGPARGRLTTQSASTYKLPSLGELPGELHVAFLEHAHEEGVVHGAKAVGEPPLMLALSVREALREAAAAFGPPGTSVDLASPATPEAVFWAVERARGSRADHLVRGIPGVVPDRPDPAAPPLHPRSEQAAHSPAEA